MAVVGNWVPSGNDQTRLTLRLRQAVQQLQYAVSEFKALTDIMAQMAPASDYTTIELEFSVQAGSGQTAHDVVGSCSTALQGAAVLAAIQRFG